MGAEFHALTTDDALRHIPDDGLSAIGGIPMKPDKLIGLRNTARYRQSISLHAPNIEYTPTANKDLLFPFLVLEAKREKGAPGFRAVEMQTAFAIRSLLGLQDGLRRASQDVLQPLVWFLGSQGDLWRLYGATLHRDEIVSRQEKLLKVQR